MGKISDLLYRFDHFVDRKIGNFWIKHKKRLPAFGMTLVCLMVSITIWRGVKNKPDFVSSMIRNDVERIAEIVQKIDKQCAVQFKQDRNFVDFLTIEKLSSADVGTLSLHKPEKWEGPYFKENPALSNKLYEIVRAQDGYFVLPGTGVELPNGFVMGHDIVVTPQVSVEALIRSGGVLNYRGNKLAARVDTLHLGNEF